MRETGVIEKKYNVWHYRVSRSKEERLIILRKVSISSRSFHQYRNSVVKIFRDYSQGEDFILSFPKVVVNDV